MITLILLTVNRESLQYRMIDWVRNMCDNILEKRYVKPEGAGAVMEISRLEVCISEITSWSGNAASSAMVRRRSSVAEFQDFP